MGKVIIIDKDVATSESIERLLAALQVPCEIALTHKNALRAYTSGSISAVFLSPDIPTIDPKALVEEFDLHAKNANTARPPVIVLYKDLESVQRYNLDKLPRSKCLQKPITYEKIYPLLHALGLTKLGQAAGSRGVQAKIARYDKFIQESEAWLKKLKAQLFPS